MASLGCPSMIAVVEGIAARVAARAARTDLVNILNDRERF